MIWSLYSSRGLRESAIKDLPVQTVVEDTTDPQTRAALSASTRLCFPEANADYYGEEALQSQVVVRGPQFDAHPLECLYH